MRRELAAVIPCQRLESVHCGLLKSRFACCNHFGGVQLRETDFERHEQCLAVVDCGTKSALELVCRIDGLLSPSRILEEV